MDQPQMSRTLLFALILAACGPVQTHPNVHEIEAVEQNAPSSEAQPPRVCASSIAESTFERAVDGSHRGCEVDADCASLKLDCSNVRCTAVNADHLASYAEPIECQGFGGPTANYDCISTAMPANAEQPVCVAGCCMNERSVGRATPDEACGAIAGVYSRDSCTLFGPTFSVEQCLTDIDGIREDAGDERLLQIGLDCARGVSTCAQVQFCVSQFRAG